MAASDISYKLPDMLYIIYGDQYFSLPQNWLLGLHNECPWTRYWQVISDTVIECKPSWLGNGSLKSIRRLKTSPKSSIVFTYVYWAKNVATNSETLLSATWLGKFLRTSDELSTSLFKTKHFQVQSVSTIKVKLTDTPYGYKQVLD